MTVMPVNRDRGGALCKSLGIVSKALASILPSKKGKGQEGKGSGLKAGVSCGLWATPEGTQVGLPDF